ncbi:MAG: PHP domain-containing protein [Lachnospiraceae bacterium]
MIDLHVHSTASDGTNTPTELVALAKEAGLSAFALTDHDTISGLAEARNAAKTAGIELVPGIELSTDYNGSEVHILGYYFDEQNPEFLQKLNEFINSRDLRNEKMAVLLQKEGFDITMEELIKENPDSVITRAHFARYLVEHGMVKDRETVFSKYIGDDCRCYVPREKIDPFEAVRLIQLGGGVAFFAHPVLCHMNFDRLKRFIRDLKDCGLTGIEAIYSANSSGDERNLKQIAKDYNLLISGGSDYHGENKPYIKLGVGRGNLRIPNEILDHIKKVTT